MLLIKYTRPHVRHARAHTHLWKYEQPPDMMMPPSFGRCRLCAPCNHPHTELDLVLPIEFDILARARAHPPLFAHKLSTQHTQCLRSSSELFQWKIQILRLTTPSHLSQMGRRVTLPVVFYIFFYVGNIFQLIGLQCVVTKVEHTNTYVSMHSLSMQT